MKRIKQRKGLLFVVSAPSGAGKSTLVGRLMGAFPRLTYSISHTTRAPREGEVHGREYFFTDKDRFLALRDEGFFAEWAEVFGNFYGTPAKQVRSMRDEGRDVIFDIDVQGAMQIKKSLPEAVLVFIFPPSLKVLEERLRKRGTDKDETIERRIREAPREIEAAADYDYYVVNDDLETAYLDLQSIYLAETNRAANHPSLIDTILKGA